MAIYFVRTTGNDTTGDGSTGTPWATIDKALSTVSGRGDHTILVGDGTYAENTSSLGYLRANRRFASTVTVKRETPGANTEAVVKGSAGPYSLRLNSAVNLAFEGLTFASASVSDSTLIYCSDATATTSSISFTGCLFRADHDFGSGDYLVQFGGTTGHYRQIEFDRCTFDANGNTVRGLSLNRMDRLTFTGNRVAAPAQLLLCGSGMLAPVITGNRFAATADGDVVSFSELAESTSVTFADNVVTTSGATATDNAVYVGGGASSSVAVRVNVDRNTVRAPGMLGIRLHRYIEGGTASDNDVIAVNMALAVRSDSASAGGLKGVEVARNRLRTTATGGHTLLLSDGAEMCSVHHNYCDAEAGSYGCVVKGSMCDFTDNTFIGGDRNAIFFKGAAGHVARRNTLVQRVAGGYAVEVGADDDTNASADLVFVDNDLTATAGSLMLWGSASGDSGGSGCDGNRYRVGSAAAWGTVRGSTITSLATLQAAWSGYDVAANDAVSQSSGMRVAANVEQINGATIQGDGTSGNKWRS